MATDRVGGAPGPGDPGLQFARYRAQQCRRAQGLPRSKNEPAVGGGFGGPPTPLQNMNRGSQANAGFSIRPVPPFRLDLTVWALRRRSRNVVDRWDGSTYRRVITIGRRPVELAVRQAHSCANARLIVKTTP